MTLRSADRQQRAAVDEVREINQRLLMAGLRLQESAEAAESARQRVGFLLDISSALIESSPLPARLLEVARLAVPFLADTCLFDLLVDSDQPVSLVVGPRPDLPNLAGAVLQTGTSQMVVDLSQAGVAGPLPSATVERLQALRVQSCMVVALTVGSDVLGTLTFLAVEPRLSYAAPDLLLAEHVARRCALAIHVDGLQREVEHRAQLEGALLAARTIQDRLGNRLNGAKGFAELLLHDETLSSTSRHFAEVVLQELSDAEGTMRTLLSLSTVELAATGQTAPKLIHLGAAAAPTDAKPPGSLGPGSPALRKL